MDQNNSIVPSVGASLAQARGNFRTQLEMVAEANVAQYGDDYTPLERRALSKVEQLRLLGGFELMTLLERGSLMNEIEQEGLVSVFPGEYENLEQVCQAIGISKSEYSDTRGLCDVIFPWLEANTDRSLQEWWEEIGKSKFRELLPVLRGLIEGESARNHETVNEAIRHQLNNAAAGIVTEASNEAGRELTADEIFELQQAVTESGALQHRAILSVLEFGALPVREMRQQVRPNHTPNINGTMIRGDQRSYAVLRMGDDQIEMFQRLMGTHIDMAYVSEDEFQEQVRFLSRIIPD
jgi:hypothetical protein